jgi:hypothetical protein
VRNEALSKLEGLVGEWRMTMTGAWFLESPDITAEGSATIEWLGEAFLELRATFGVDHGTWHWVIGRSDAREQLALLNHDERGVLRVLEMSFGDGQWTLARKDPDFTSVHRDRGA